MKKTEDGITPDMLEHIMLLNFGMGELWVQKRIKKLIKNEFIFLNKTGVLIWKN